MTLRSRLKKLTNDSAGFNLIELMIVIAIIGILAQVAALQVNQALGRTRDNIRRDTLRRIQQALEVYHDDKGVYPTVVTGASFSDPGGNNTVFGYSPTWLTGMVPAYLSKYPTDPLGGWSNFNANCGPAWPRSYVYTSWDAGKNYKIASHCSAESGQFGPTDPFYDPSRPAWCWQLTSDPIITAAW